MVLFLFIFDVVCIVLLTKKIRNALQTGEISVGNSIKVPIYSVLYRRSTNSRWFYFYVIWASLLLVLMCCLFIFLIYLTWTGNIHRYL